MGLTLTDNGGGGDYSPVPEGTHIARCVRVIDLGMQPGSQQYPEPRAKVLLAWEIPDEPIKIDGEERPALIMARFTASLHKKSQLRALLESWRGRAFTDEELKGFSLKHILDVPCMVTVVHSEANGRTYANVKSVAKMPKGVPAPARVTPLTWYEIEDGHNTVYHELSEKLRAAIDVGAGRTPAEPAPVSPPASTVDVNRRTGQLAQVMQANAQTAAPPVQHDFAGDAEVPF